MANVMRWLNLEDTAPVVAPVHSGYDVEIGDLMFMEREDGLARPASAIADLGTLTGNQQYFACRFLGVAMQRFRTGHDPADLSTIRVATRGRFKYPVAALAAALHLGTLFSVDENAAGTALLDQQLEAVGLTQGELAICRLSKRALAGDTEVEVQIVSEIMDGGFDADTCTESSSSSGV